MVVQVEEKKDKHKRNTRIVSHRSIVLNIFLLSFTMFCGVFCVLWCVRACVRYWSSQVDK